MDRSEVLDVGNAAWSSGKGATANDVERTREGGWTSSDSSRERTG